MTIFSKIPILVTIFCTYLIFVFSAPPPPTYILMSISAALTRKLQPPASNGCILVRYSHFLLFIFITNSISGALFINSRLTEYKQLTNLYNGIINVKQTVLITVNQATIMCQIRIPITALCQYWTVVHVQATCVSQ